MNITCHLFSIILSLVFCGVFWPFKNRSGFNISSTCLVLFAASHIAVVRVQPSWQCPLTILTTRGREARVVTWIQPPALL